MLLSNVVFPVDVPLQSGKDQGPLQERVPALALQIQQGSVREAVGVRHRVSVRLRWRQAGGPLRWNGKVFELFPEDDDGLLVKEWVLLQGRRIRRDWPIVLAILFGQGGRAIEGLSS